MSESRPDLSDWTAGTPLSAAKLSAPLPVVRTVQSITGGAGIVVTQSPAGTVISLASPNGPIERTAVVTITGNATKPGLYKGYRRREVIDHLDPDSTTTFDEDGSNTFGEVPSDTEEIYIANAGERSTNTHALTEADADVSVDHVGFFRGYALDGKEIWAINGSTGISGCPS